MVIDPASLLMGLLLVGIVIGCTIALVDAMVGAPDPESMRWMDLAPDDWDADDALDNSEGER